MPDKPLRVFLDANVVIRCGKPPGAPIMPRIADLVKGGHAKIVTTDLTKMEVAKKHANNDLPEIGMLAKRRIRDLIKKTMGVEIPHITLGELQRKVVDDYVADTERMFASLRAQNISIDTVPPTTVFDAYAQKSGLFSGEGKKDQFPDAFIFEALKATATADDPLVIVTDDNDFDAVIKGADHITRLKSISALFDELGLAIEAAQYVEAFFKETQSDLIAAVDRELNSWGLQVSDIENAEIDESEVTSVNVQHFVTYATGRKDANILVVGNLEAEVIVSYNHPDWDTATYDSEDKVLLPHRHVSGAKEVSIESNFTLLIAVNTEGKPIRIKEFSFDDESFIWVSLLPNDMDYK
jgi:PIN domain